MKPDKLRALAHALEPMAAAPCFDGIDIAAAADYLRAQADAQPVEWRVDARYAGERRWSPYLHCRSQHEAEQMATIAAQANVETRIVPLYAHPAPAAPQAEPSLGELMREQRRSRIVAGAYPDGNPNAVAMMAQTPQAEPCIGNDSACPCQDGDACHYKDAADGTKAWPVPQAEPKREPTGAPYGIIDPDYGRVYTIARKLAWEEGYAIGLHGSFTRDLDLIAVPWAERACEAEHLIRRIVDATGLKLRDGVGVKPHGRRAWTLLFPAFGDPRFVDLSVMPRIGGSDAQAEPKREPLTLTQIGTLSTQGMFSLMDPLDVAEAVRLVERAHGIGGSDAE